MQLPETFTKNMKQYFQKAGEDWLEELPSLITYCEQKWNVKVGSPFKLSFNYVAPATTPEGKKVVVKISPPNPEASQELEALQAFNGNGINRLLDYDLEKRMMLIEHIHPGEMLATVSSEEEATKIAAKVLQNLWTNPPENTTLPSTKDRETNLRTYAENHPNGNGPISKEVLTEAINMISQLNATTTNTVLLHGDFHHYNVLSNGDGWIAIDPKGLIGEKEHDLTQYMLNCLPEKNKASTIEKRAALFASELSLNKERIIQWGFCHAVLSLCWSISDEENSDEKYDTSAIEAYLQLLKL